MAFTENHQWVKEKLKEEFYITAFSVEDSRKVAVEERSRKFRKAMEALPQAKTLVEDSQKSCRCSGIASQPGRTARRLVSLIPESLQSLTLEDNIAI